MNAEQPPPNSETIPPSDVEGLVASIGGSGSSGTSAATAPVTAPVSQPHVFRRFSSFSPEELRKLEARHEEFVRSLAARLSVYLRLEIGLKLMKLEAMPFGKLLQEIPNLSYIARLRMEPLKGICLLAIPPQLAGSLVDRELGGTGECLGEDRALTDIECRIISRIVETLIGEWCQTWSDLMDLKPALSGHESGGASIRDFSSDTMMLVVGVEMQMGELTKPLHFVFPYATLGPLFKKLNVGTGEEMDSGAAASPKLPKWNPIHDDIKVKVTAEFPGLKITARELGDLKAGDVIQLDPEVFQHLRISLAKKPKFIATAGKCGTAWAAKITKPLNVPANS